MNLSDETIDLLVDMSVNFSGGLDGLREISEIPEALTDLVNAVFFYYARDTNFEDGTKILTQDLFVNSERLKSKIFEKVES